VDWGFVELAKKLRKNLKKVLAGKKSLLTLPPRSDAGCI